MFVKDGCVFVSLCRIHLIDKIVLGGQSLISLKDVYKLIWGLSIL